MIHLFQSGALMKPNFLSSISSGSLWAVALLPLLISACSSTPLQTSESNKPPVVEKKPEPVANQGNPSSVTPVNTSDNPGKIPPAKPEGKMPRVIYFDFDSFVVKNEFLQVVEVNAKALSSDRNRRLAVEGHADERGGREYNLALGQKRAEAVARSLTVLGASSKQLEIVSFGKERPAVVGSGESVWAQNRRAELNPRQ